MLTWHKLLIVHYHGKNLVRYRCRQVWIHNFLLFKQKIYTLKRYILSVYGAVSLLYHRPPFFAFRLAKRRIRWQTQKCQGWTFLQTAQIGIDRVSPLLNSSNLPVGNKHHCGSISKYQFIFGGRLGYFDHTSRFDLDYHGRSKIFEGRYSDSVCTNVSEANKLCSATPRQCKKLNSQAAKHKKAPSLRFQYLWSNPMALWCKFHYLSCHTKIFLLDSSSVGVAGVACIGRKPQGRNSFFHPAKTRASAASSSVSSILEAYKQVVGCWRILRLAWRRINQPWIKHKRKHKIILHLKFLYWDYSIHYTYQTWHDRRSKWPKHTKTTWNLEACHKPLNVGNTCTHRILFWSSLIGPDKLRILFQAHMFHSSNSNKTSERFQGHLLALSPPHFPSGHPSSLQTAPSGHQADVTPPYARPVLQYLSHHLHKNCHAVKAVQFYSWSRPSGSFKLPRLENSSCRVRVSLGEWFDN